jgi:hypothetical protein
MEGYIYTMYKDADPGNGWHMDDPILKSKTPTLGACMTNFRRSIKLGDYIFVVSGNTKNLQQYVVGGFQVQEKINALAAYDRFPENRKQQVDGIITGNIIIDANGQQHHLDNHSNFESRLENYLVGCNPILLDKPKEIARAREQSLPFLSGLFERPGSNRIFDVVARGRKLNEAQVVKMINWLEGLKS